MCNVALVTRLSITFLLAASLSIGVPAAGVARGSIPGLSLTAPRKANAGTTIAFTVHSLPRVRIQFEVVIEGAKYTAARRTGTRGRTAFLYVIPYPKAVTPLHVTVRTTVGRRRLSVQKNVLVLPFQPRLVVHDVHLLVREGGDWIPATQVYANSDVRFVATYTVYEPSGGFAPNCVSAGTLRITAADGSTVLNMPAQCPSSQLSNSLPYVYVDARLPDVSVGSPLQAEFDLSYDEGAYGMAQGSGAVVFAVLRSTYTSD